VRSLSRSSTPRRCSSSASSHDRSGFLVSTPTRTGSRISEDFIPIILQRGQSLRTPNRFAVKRTRPISNTKSSLNDSRSPFVSNSPQIISSPYETNYRYPISRIQGRDSFTPPVPSSKPYVLQRGGDIISIRDVFYFTSKERLDIAELVHAKPHNCQRHTDCTDCYNLEYAYHENKRIPTTMPVEERQKIISNNRSLRNIKTVCITCAAVELTS
jgi:hypothetical protein